MGAGAGRVDDPRLSGPVPDALRAFAAALRAGGQEEAVAAGRRPLPLVALGLYAFYESGISVYTNIRVDLLLIYPALFVTLLSWPALIVAALVRR